MSSFPIGSSVLLQNLKSDQYNDKKGIVKSSVNSTSGRQEVYIFDINKSMSIKPANMRYEPREISSLSISEMKGMLLVSLKQDKEPEEWKGLNKEDLQKMVADVTTRPDEIASLIAKANEPKAVPTANNNHANASFTSEQLREATNRMTQMDPAQLRQQARKMKAIGPAALRNLNPQMANMTDEQINMAISQMEAMANNPEMLRMATEQMKGMGEAELREAIGQSGASAAPRPVVSTSSASTSTSVLPDAVKSMTSDQFKEASKKISSLSPGQLKSQAAMLKSMPLETLRKTNPQMANMTDDQIKIAIEQMERMAEDPSMMKLAAEQMKNMDENQFESIKAMFQGGGVGSTSSSTAQSTSTTNGQAAMADLMSDPSKMMESLLSNPEQLSSMIKTMKQNPDLIKSVMRSQMGIKDDNGDVTNPDPRMEQMEKAIDQFANMSDEQLDKYIKYANKAQRVFQPVLSSFNKAKTTLGVSSKAMIIVMNLFICGVIALLVMWIRSRGGATEVGLSKDLSDLQSDNPPEIVSGHDYSEF
ncbi:hypothetical protein HJC23_000508 [Cyclotella cryptica]|uniref:Uncharacterized protein n=1 Tax=Cyclotella cryptica TaxID=29204 RepID=A0ABD3NQM0_9STRA|eukprot:CCRYP_020132-RA/>CCRYP_020132-RA protein AED:0.30 eAED:0.30 QI:0/-1/0/1/-1/1/1/0/533